MPPARHSLTDRVFRYIVDRRRKRCTKIADRLGRHLSHHIHIVGKSRFSVGHAGHRTNHMVVDTLRLKKIGDDLHQLMKLKFTVGHDRPLRG